MMKKVTLNTIFISVLTRIAITFLFMMLVSFIPENFREFFGDTLYEFTDRYGGHRLGWHWGTRHYILFWASVFFVIANVVYHIFSVNNLINKYLKQKK